MMSSNPEKRQTDEYILWVLAKQSREFAAFQEDLRRTLPAKLSMPPELTEHTLSILQADPKMAELYQTYSENLDKAKTYALPELGGVGIIIAAVFLLRSHIKIKRNTSGKWEFLFEHEAEDSAVLEKVISILTDLFNQS